MIDGDGSGDNDGQMLMIDGSGDNDGQMVMVMIHGSVMGRW